MPLRGPSGYVTAAAHRCHGGNAHEAVALLLPAVPVPAQQRCEPRKEVGRVAVRAKGPFSVTQELVEWGSVLLHPAAQGQGEGARQFGPLEVRPGTVVAVAGSLGATCAAVDEGFEEEAALEEGASPHALCLVLRLRGGESGGQVTAEGRRLLRGFETLLGSLAQPTEVFASRFVHAFPATRVVRVVPHNVWADDRWRSAGAVRSPCPHLAGHTALTDPHPPLGFQDPEQTHPTSLAAGPARVTIRKWCTTAHALATRPPRSSLPPGLQV